MEKLKNKSMITGICLIVAVIAGLVYYFAASPKDITLPPGHIIEKDKDIRLSDLVKVLRKNDFNESDMNAYFAKEIINDYTVYFFKSLQWRFRSSPDLDSHYQDVCSYLKSQKPLIRNAEDMCAFYKKFTEYEMSLEKQIASWGAPGNAAQALVLLEKQQEFRRKFFGEDIADALFRAEVKSQEYSIRRTVIVNDRKLYGDVKLQMLYQLDQEMWGDEAEAIEKSSILNDPYNKYREKLVIYARDLSEMAPQAKDDFMRTTRREFFPEEVVKRFELLDAENELDKQKLATYYEREEEIVNDPDIPEKDRDQAIKDLQNQMFGKEGSLAFRRVEAIRKAGGGKAE